MRERALRERPLAFQGAVPAARVGGTDSLGRWSYGVRLKFVGSSSGGGGKK